MRSLFFGLVLSLCALNAYGEASADDMNSSNNPLTPMAAVNLQDYLQSSVYGTSQSLNTGYLRIASPMMFGGMPQLARMTIPYMPAALETPTSTVSGVGDVNIFDVFLLGNVKGVQMGVGPMLVIPTASKDQTGSGKWQIGGAGVAMWSNPWGLLGGLLTYQHDFAGDSKRATQNLATFQPFFIYNFPSAFYFRTTGIMLFNWETGDYNIPLGAGFGKVWKLQGGTTVNLYAEPQWTIAHEGLYTANYQTLIGLNFQFPLK